MIEYPHEMFGGPDCDRTVEQHSCRECHAEAHAEYDRTVQEIVDGTVDRHPDDEMPRILINDPNYGPTRFLLIWHGTNGYCPLHEPIPDRPAT